MKASTAVALGVGAVVIAGGATAAVLYLGKSAPPPSAKLPTTTVERIVVAPPTAYNGNQGPAPGAGIVPPNNPAPQQTDAQRIAGDVKAYADAAKSVAGAVGDVAAQLKGFFA